MRRRAIPLAVALLVLGGLEIAVRTASARIPEPVVWNGREVQNKLARIDALSRTTSASVVFAGSSSMQAAADARLATQLAAAKAPAFNAALNGSDLRSVAFWLTKVVSPRLHPRVVVVGATSLEWNDNGLTQADFYGKLIESEAARKLTGRLGTIGRIESWLEDNSYLARYRNELRRPATILRGKPRLSENDVDAFGTLRAVRAFQTRPFAISERFRRRTEQESFHNYSVGGVQAQALARLSTQLRRMGTTLVIVKMPVTWEVIGMHPRGRKDYKAYERVLKRVVESNQVVFVDAASRITDPKYFVDPVHLNADGARRFTRLLAPVLRSLVRG